MRTPLHRALRAAALLALLLLAPATARAQAAAVDATTATATATTSTDVAIGFYVYEFKEVNLKDQTFLADFYLWIRFDSKDEEFAKEAEGIDFMNGRVEAREEVDRRQEGSERYVCWRYLVTFYLRFDLHRYPFDTQRFDLVVEPHVYDVDRLVFVDDARSYANNKITPPHLAGVKPGGVRVGEFALERVERIDGRSMYDTDFGDLVDGNGGVPYSRFTLSLVFVRDFRPYFFKILIPLMIIVATAYLVFLLPPSEIQTGSGLGLTALLTCMAFNVSVTQSLPEIGYLITSDKFFISTYFLLFLTLLQVLIVFRWQQAGDAERADRWYARCRVIFPMLYTGSFAILIADAMSP